MYKKAYKKNQILIRCFLSFFSLSTKNKKMFFFSVIEFYFQYLKMQREVSDWIYFREERRGEAY